MGGNRKTGDAQHYHWTIHREILRLVIGRRGYTPHSLAVAVGIDKRVLYRLLSGERTGTTYPTAEAVARALDVDITLFADPSIRWMPIQRDAS